MEPTDVGCCLTENNRDCFHGSKKLGDLGVLAVYL
jgi:hypothetical protein